MSAIELKLYEKREFIATKQDISEAKVDLVKWMVGFWIAQMAAIIGLYVVVINSLYHIRQ